MYKVLNIVIQLNQNITNNYEQNIKILSDQINQKKRIIKYQLYLKRYVNPNAKSNPLTI